MMVKELGYLDYTNPIIGSYYGIKERFVSFLEKHRLLLYINADNNEAIVYDREGNDLEHMTLKQLSRRVKIKYLD